MQDDYKALKAKVSFFQEEKIGGDIVEKDLLQVL